jgi:hypothetical protein
MSEWSRDFIHDQKMLRIKMTMEDAPERYADSGG